MPQKTFLCNRDESLRRTYSQGYGAELLFQDMKPKAGTAVREDDVAASLASDFALFQSGKTATDQPWKVAEIARSYEFDVMKIISIRSQSELLDTIPSYPGSSVDSEAELCTQWSEVKAWNSEGYKLPNRASSGAESILPEPCEINTAAACLKDLDTIFEQQGCPSQPSCTSCGMEFSREQEKDMCNVLLPWDM